LTFGLRIFLSLTVCVAVVVSTQKLGASQEPSEKTHEVMPTPTIGQSFPELLAIHDADMDGLSDDKEFDLGTDMNRADTDGDGWPDGAERDGRSDPLDPTGEPTNIYVARPVVQIIIPGLLTIPIEELIFQNGFERPSGEWIELIGLGFYIAAPTSISVVLPAQGDVNGLTTNVTIAAPRRIQVNWEEEP